MMNTKKLVVLLLLLLLGIYGCGAETNSDLTCTVTFKVDGTVYDTVVVDCGDTAVLSKENPTKEGWIFIGWDKPLNNIKTNTVVNAVWEKIEEEEIVLTDDIIITVNNKTKAEFTAWKDGSVGVKTFTLKQGETLTIPEILYDSYDNTEKNNSEYEFLGWYYKDKNNQEKEFGQSKEIDLGVLNVASNKISVYAKIKKKWTYPY